jgi:hypothetical protein
MLLTLAIRSYPSLMIYTARALSLNVKDTFIIMTDHTGLAPLAGLAFVHAFKTFCQGPQPVSVPLLSFLAQDLPALRISGYSFS